MGALRGCFGWGGLGGSVVVVMLLLLVLLLFVREGVLTTWKGMAWGA